MCAEHRTPIPSEGALPLSRAKLARFIAAMFCDAPATWAGMLATPETRSDLSAAAAALGLAPDLCEAVFAAYQPGDAAREGYDRLFGHTVRSACPPYELEYRTADVFQQSQTLADIAGFYRAFELEVGGPVAERPDHVATQWEFLAVLGHMESRAASPEESAGCIETQRAFLADHSAAWMPAFFERLRRAHAGAFWVTVANLADAVLEEWCGALGLELGPRWLRLRDVTEADASISCGGPGAVELGPTLAAALKEQG